MESDNTRRRRMTAAVTSTVSEGGGAEQHQLHPLLPYYAPPAPAVYSVPPSLPLQPYPLYHQLPLSPLHTYHHLTPYPPVYQSAVYPAPPTHHTLPAPPIHPYRTRYTQDQLPWLQQLNQSDCELSEGVMRGVCGEVVESVLPDLVREMVSATVNDVICSYIGQQWARGAGATRASQFPLALTHSHHTTGSSDQLPSPDREALLKPHRDDYQHVLHGKDTTEVCSDVCQLLTEQILFLHLLTSDLDGGVAMAARTQAPHILEEMMFDELLSKLITTSI